MMVTGGRKSFMLGLGGLKDNILALFFGQNLFLD